MAARNRPADPVPFTGADGHTYVTLTKPDGTAETCRIADLVAATFQGFLGDALLDPMAKGRQGEELADQMGKASCTATPDSMLTA